MRKLTEDAATAFLRAIRVSFVSFAGDFTLHELVSRSWASVTFSGARHRIAFSLEGAGAQEAASDFLGRMNEAEFDLRGHILADITLTGEERSFDKVKISLEALTVEDN
jgi:hypothetical protein